MIYTVHGLENDHHVREMLLCLLPAETPERVEFAPEGTDALGVAIDHTGTETVIRVCCTRGGRQVCVEQRAPVTDSEEDTKRAQTHAVKSAIFEAVTPFLDAVPEWGSLTGVRPAKFARGFLEKGYTPVQIGRAHV